MERSHGVQVEKTAQKPALFNHYPDSSSELFTPSVTFFRPDAKGLSAKIGTSAVVALRDPWNVRNILNSGYDNFRLQPKRDLIGDEDEKGWTILLKKSLGEERIDCEVAVRECFRSLFARLEKTNLDYAHSHPLYIGKPAYGELRFEQRYVRRISQICKDIGFSLEPVFVYEPYAIMYYCQHIARIEFPAPGKRRRTRILIVDHGGGTFSTCVIELNTEGRVSAEAKPIRPISKEDTGGRRLDELILKGIIDRINVTSAVKSRLLQRERPTFPLVDEALLLVESAKIECIEKRDASPAHTASLHIPTGLSDFPFLDATLSLKEIRDAFGILWKIVKSYLDATLRGESSAPEAIHHVVLAGGTCKTGFHRDLLEKHYGDHFDRTLTRFIDISTEKLPVSKGIGYQALIDYVKQYEPETKASDLVSADNLSNIVAHDLYLNLERERGGDDHDILGQAKLIAAGTSKSDVWDKQHTASVSMNHRIPQRFRLAIRTEVPSRDEHNDPNARSITVRHSEHAKAERKAKAIVRINSDGNYAHVLRDQGISYGDYVEHIPTPHRVVQGALGCTWT